MMRELWDGKLKNAVFLYCGIYTVITILNSVLFLMEGVRDDPSGNWHEITRAVIVLLGVIAYEMAVHLPVRNVFARILLTYIPTILLVFVLVWASGFLDPLAESAYRDAAINYTGFYILIAIVAVVKDIRAQKE